MAAAAAKCSSSSPASNAKYGGAITATPSAPASAACAASARVSAVVWAPQCTITRSASDSPTISSATRRRSSRSSRTPSPVVPSDEQPIDAAGGVELDQRRERAFVEPVAAVA